MAKTFVLVTLCAQCGGYVRHPVTGLDHVSRVLAGWRQALSDDALLEWHRHRDGTLGYLAPIYIEEEPEEAVE